MNTAVLEQARCPIEEAVIDVEDPVVNQFENVDRCCCKLVHVKRGTYIISYISAFFIVTNLLMKIAGYSETAWDWELLFLVVDTIALASMFYGIYTERASFIQPFVVLALITTSFLILLAASMFCAAYDPNSYSGQDLEHELNKRLSDTAHQLSVQLKSMISIVATVFLIFILLSLSAHCFFIVVSIQCAKYFRQLDEKTAHAIKRSEELK